jgi:hypothetical protein
VPCTPGHTMSPTVCRSCSISDRDKPSSGPFTVSRPLGSTHSPLLFLLPTRLTRCRSEPEPISAAVSGPIPIASIAVKPKTDLTFLDFMPKRLQKNPACDQLPCRRYKSGSAINIEPSMTAHDGEQAQCNAAGGPTSGCASLNESAPKPKYRDLGSFQNSLPQGP